jgi:hypothetical protein
MVFLREPGADDAWPDVRMPGQMLTGVRVTKAA